MAEYIFTTPGKYKSPTIIIIGTAIKGRGCSWCVLLFLGNFSIWNQRGTSISTARETIVFTKYAISLGPIVAQAAEHVDIPTSGPPTDSYL